MTREQAFELFDELERPREDDVADDGANPEVAMLRLPTYDVRLDAITTREMKRDFRVRVTPGGETGGICAEDWQFAIGVAVDAGVGCTVQNSGLEFV